MILSQTSDRFPRNVHGAISPYRGMCSSGKTLGDVQRNEEEVDEARAPAWFAPSTRLFAGGYGVLCKYTSFLTTHLRVVT